MTPEKAIRKFWEFYGKAKGSGYIRNPVAWALYQVWKEADNINVSSTPANDLYDEDGGELLPGGATDG